MHESIHGSVPSDEIDRAIVEILQQQRSGCPASKLPTSLAKRGYSISQPTLLRRLARLQAQRHVAVRGAGRGTVYEPDSYHDWFSLPPTRRPKASYNVRLLETFIPNETRWFAQEEIERPRGNPHRRRSSGAWAPKSITINHRPRQFFARSCNRDSVINPADPVERGLHGTQDMAMLGGVVAPERVDDNVCHYRARRSGELGNSLVCVLPTSRIAPAPSAPALSLTALSL